MYCYVVKSLVFRHQRGNFQKNQEFPQKWKFFKILPVTYWKIKMKIMIKIFFWIPWCIKDLWGTKIMYCYVVKWLVFRLQTRSVKSPLAPSNISSLWLILFKYFVKPYPFFCFLYSARNSHFKLNPRPSKAKKHLSFGTIVFSYISMRDCQCDLIFLTIYNYFNQAQDSRAAENIGLFCDCLK